VAKAPSQSQVGLEGVGCQMWRGGDGREVEGVMRC
jgi:hypothetical protein